jgi:CHASE2 domain-containing sensor protein
MNNFYNAFISYGRADSKTFATNLYQRLSEQGLKVWFDQNDIPLGVDFQNQIDSGITKADNFLFIIAPHSVNSPYCRKEIDLALRLNKRIIPLLHVEQITQSTWQERNPDKDLSEWEAYKAKGLHSSFPNMHPAIGKINWIYLREGIDDFEKSFAGLLEIFDRHQDYVHQHTYLLTKALEWEREERQSRYLLIGEERKQAENWLKIKFKDEQPPCEPTDLHCAFITESIKNANNLMTQVFLCYADKDRELMEKIAKTLMRESFTVWTNKTDIKSGEEFEKAIERGIEEADNVVSLISSDSLQSEYCQRELSLAFSLNKPIIPLLVEDIDVNLIPSQIRTLQFISFVDGQGEEEYLSDTGKLINTLRQDAVYYEQHKIILAKALKWERQKCNPNILLRGYNLRSAEAWLKVAKQKNQHQPTPLQEKFITQSLEQPPESTLDVFISYSRADSDFARKLNETLQIQNKTTWFDQESIASGSDFQQEIHRGIECANNFLFIISPNSLTSSYCNPQLEYAVKLNKRIVPVLYQEVDSAHLPPELTKVQWIDFNSNGGDFLTNFGELTRTLDTDPDYMRSHTRLLLRAKEWEQQGRDESFLLRGKDLAVSETWLKQAQKKEPAPTSLQLEYLAASHALPHRKIKHRGLFFASLATTALVFGLRFFGLIQALELRMYDFLIIINSFKYLEKDDRFLIVEINKQDINVLDDYDTNDSSSSNTDGKIKDEGRAILKYSVLKELITKISDYQPRVIGVNFPIDVYDKNLEEHLTPIPKQVIIQCENSSQNQDAIANQKLPFPEQIGSFGIVDDDPSLGRFLRRDTLLQIPSDKSCQTEISFSLLIAIQYLKSKPQGINYTLPQRDGNKYTGELKIGDITIPRLHDNMAGPYKSLDHEDGRYDTMLNYRISKSDANSEQKNEHISPEHFAKRVNILEILNNSEKYKEDIKNKIVLIGQTDSVCDSFDTPLGEVSSIFIQGQMSSQIIDAVEGKRALISWLSVKYQALWIFGWSLFAGVIFRQIERKRYLIILVVISIISIYVAGIYIFLKYALWVPFTPTVFAFLSTGLIVVFLTFRLRKV